MLKQFFSLLGRYIKPYRRYVTWAVILNFLSQWLNVFSFAAIIPILNILFKVDNQHYEYMPVDWSHLDKDVLINNAAIAHYGLISQIGEELWQRLNACSAKDRETALRLLTVYLQSLN